MSPDSIIFDSTLRENSDGMPPRTPPNEKGLSLLSCFRRSRNRSGSLMARSISLNCAGFTTLSPVLDRMRELQAKRPTMKRVFSGEGGRGMLPEMSQGSDGTMPGAGYTDVYVQIWDAWQAGDRKRAREIFMHLLPVINLEEMVELGYQHMLHRRGVFKTSVSRIPRTSMTPEIKAEIDAAFEDLKPYLRV